MSGSRTAHKLAPESPDTPPRTPSPLQRYRIDPSASSKLDRFEQKFAGKGWTLSDVEAQNGDEEGPQPSKRSEQWRMDPAMDAQLDYHVKRVLEQEEKIAADVRVNGPSIDETPSRETIARLRTETIAAARPDQTPRSPPRSPPESSHHSTRSGRSVFSRMTMEQKSEYASRLGTIQGTLPKDATDDDFGRAAQKMAHEILNRTSSDRPAKKDLRSEVLSDAVTSHSRSTRSPDTSPGLRAVRAAELRQSSVVRDGDEYYDADATPSTPATTVSPGPSSKATVPPRSSLPALAPVPELDDAADVGTLTPAPETEVFASSRGRPHMSREITHQQLDGSFVYTRKWSHKMVNYSGVDPYDLLFSVKTRKAPYPSHTTDSYGFPFVRHSSILSPLMTDSDPSASSISSASTSKAKTATSHRSDDEAAMGEMLDDQDAVSDISTVMSADDLKVRKRRKHRSQHRDAAATRNDEKLTFSALRDLEQSEREKLAELERWRTLSLDQTPFDIADIGDAAASPPLPDSSRIVSPDSPSKTTAYPTQVSHFKVERATGGGARLGDGDLALDSFASKPAPASPAYKWPTRRRESLSCERSPSPPPMTSLLPCMAPATLSKPSPPIPRERGGYIDKGTPYMPGQPHMRDTNGLATRPTEHRRLRMIDGSTLASPLSDKEREERRALRKTGESADFGKTWMETKYAERERIQKERPAWEAGFAELARRQDPESAEWWFLMGEHYSKGPIRFLRDKALTAYEQSVSLDPQPYAWEALANAYIARGNYEQAVEIFTDLHSNMKKREALGEARSLRYLTRKGLIYYGPLGKLDLAENTFLDVVSSDPPPRENEGVSSYLHLGKCHEKKGRMRAAKNAWETAAKLRFEEEQRGGLKPQDTGIPLFEAEYIEKLVKYATGVVATMPKESPDPADIYAKPAEPASTTPPGSPPSSVRADPQLPMRKVTETLLSSYPATVKSPRLSDEQLDEAATVPVSSTSSKAEAAPEPRGTPDLAKPHKSSPLRNELQQDEPRRRSIGTLTERDRADDPWSLPLGQASVRRFRDVDTQTAPILTREMAAQTSPRMPQEMTEPKAHQSRAAVESISDDSSSTRTSRTKASKAAKDREMTEKYLPRILETLRGLKEVTAEWVDSEETRRDVSFHVGQAIKSLASILTADRMEEASASDRVVRVLSDLTFAIDSLPERLVSSASQLHSGRRRSRAPKDTFEHAEAVQQAIHHLDVLRQRIALDSAR